MSKRIAIIGGGNLGVSIAEGLLLSGYKKPEEITVTKRNTVVLEPLQRKGVLIESDNLKAVKDADIILICVKPYQVKEVLEQLAPAINSSHILVSVVTGVTIEQLNEFAGGGKTIFRAMPNTAIAIQQSMTCISHSNASETQAELVHELFSKLGKVVTIEEKLMDAATVLGACGTAYAMRYIRANIQGGIEIGFDAATARLIAAQTVRGAAEMLLVNNTHPESEIDKVTTPQGCTIAGLNEMEHRGFSSSLIRGLTASFKKIKGMI